MAASASALKTFRSKLLPIEKVLVSSPFAKRGAFNVVSRFSRERDGMLTVRVHADGRGGVREVPRVAGDENEFWVIH